MGDKIVWNTVHIKVPQEFITVGKNGAIKIKPPLTRTKKISSFNKEPAIQLEPADVEKVVIVDEGKKDTIDTMKGRKKKEKEETAEMESEDINRAETVHERMTRLRSLKKKKPMSTTIKTTDVPIEPINIPSIQTTMHERMARLRSLKKKKPMKTTKTTLID